jgi:hypothetical protein
MPQQVIDHISDLWSKRRWGNFSFNHCVAYSRSQIAKSRAGSYYEKYEYWIYGFNFLVQNGQEKKESLLFRIKFSNKKELKRFFFYFAKAYQKKLAPIEIHNSEIESEEQIQDISTEDIIWALNEAASNLSYSPRKTKNLFKSVAEFI